MPHRRDVIKAKRDRYSQSKEFSVKDSPACLMMGIEIFWWGVTALMHSSQRPGTHWSSYLIQRLTKLLLAEDNFYSLFYLLTLLQSSLICIF